MTPVMKKPSGCVRGLLHRDLEVAVWTVVWHWCGGSPSPSPKGLTEYGAQGVDDERSLLAGDGQHVDGLAELVATMGRLYRLAHLQVVLEVAEVVARLVDAHVVGLQSISEWVAQASLR